MRAAWGNLRHGTATMDTLVSVGVLSAWLWSACVLVAGLGADVYLDTAAVVTTFILAGRYFEAWKGGRGLASKDRTVPGDLDTFRRWILQALARGFAKTTRGTMAETALGLNRWTKRAQTFRRNLVRSLQEAREFVIFPGRCKFVDVGGSSHSDELVESNS